MIHRSEVANKVLDLCQYAETVLQKSEFTIEKSSFNSQNEWKIENGVLSHSTGGFFHVIGLLDEASIDEHLVLYQPQGAFNGLLVRRVKDNIQVMVQARVEPGNTGVVQYGPTIQSTPANYLRLHQGKPTPYLYCFFGFDKRVQQILTSTQLDLGKRYYQKTKTLSYVLCHDELELAENMLWVSLDAIFEAAYSDQLLNTDLRSMLAVFDWQQFTCGNTIHQLPLHQANSQATLNSHSYIQTDLGKLKQWEITESGIQSLSASKPSVVLYKTQCTNREIHAWTQPLMTVNSQGVIILYCAESDGEVYWLISEDDEYGIIGRRVMMPSETIYPGESDNSLHLMGELKYEVKQSEEGGRFYQNVNHYQVRKVDKIIPIRDNQIWFNSLQLKALLQTSNQVGIQLRCISSLILKELNPGLL